LAQLPNEISKAVEGRSKGNAGVNPVGCGISVDKHSEQNQTYPGGFINLILNVSTMVHYEK